ncbi:unnamed protein product [Linum trigynum]|uniref:Uncharacterized protein n=1 Tax=Linum trigynum TaxID=586398 RepID=A0AAV2EXR1_9ROSI
MGDAAAALHCRCPILPSPFTPLLASRDPATASPPSNPSAPSLLCSPPANPPASHHSYAPPAPCHSSARSLHPAIEELCKSPAPLLCLLPSG